MNDIDIASELIARNTWWKGSLQLNFRPRAIYKTLRKFLPEKQIMALVGLRRTGKTTMMLRIVQEELEALGKENILYFSFDEFREIKLRTILQEYSKLMGKKLGEGRYLCLFDEIQKLDSWETQLKALYDTYPNIKFIISGSESLFIRKKTRESLAGRMYEFRVEPLRFKEYLDFMGIGYANIELAKGDLLSEVPSFLLSSGFPEILGKDRETSTKYIRENVVEKVIYRDIPQIVRVNDPEILEQLFKVILNDPGEIIELNGLARDFSISRQTASLYLHYLESAFLVRKVYNFSKNARKTQKRSKKYYPTITNQGASAAGELFGKTFENFIVNELSADFFWRDAYKNEVDIIKLSPFIAIEVKSGAVHDKDLRPLNAFSRKFSGANAFVISYDTEKRIGGVPVIPFYKYLLDAER